MKERRRAPRIQAKLAMEIRLGPQERAQAESINVSANGVYFSSNAYIEPLTKLQITLLLPKKDMSPKARKHVLCEGVVVRTDPEREIEGRDQYDIACYFTSISERDKEDLESYILNQLTF